MPLRRVDFPQLRAISYRSYSQAAVIGNRFAPARMQVVPDGPYLNTGKSRAGQTGSTFGVFT
jgi:hypothetical protein